MIWLLFVGAVVVGCSTAIVLLEKRDHERRLRAWLQAEALKSGEYQRLLAEMSRRTQAMAEMIGRQLAPAFAEMVQAVSGATISVDAFAKAWLGAVVHTLDEKATDLSFQRAVTGDVIRNHGLGAAVRAVHWDDGS